MKSKSFPLMQSKDQIADFISGNYHLNQNNLYSVKIQNEELVENEVTKNKVAKQFNNFKQKNNAFYSSANLIPDSLVLDFLRTDR